MGGREEDHLVFQDQEGRHSDSSEEIHDRLGDTAGDHQHRAQKKLSKASYGGGEPTIVPWPRKNTTVR